MNHHAFRPPTICPHCGTNRPPAHHLRDHGNALPNVAIAAGYCPELVARRTRTGTNSQHFAASDQRIAAAEDQALAEIDPRTANDDYAAALARALIAR